MFKFLHTADIHLDSPLLKLVQYEGAPVQRLRQATRRALENLITLAINEQVNFVLIAGDLYDGSWRDYNTGLYFISQMAKLRKAGIPVYIITGNHDAVSRMTRTLRLPDGIHMFPVDNPKTVQIDDIGVAIHGQGFATQAVHTNLSSEYPNAIGGYFNIGMLHTCATGREGHEPYAPCTIAGLQSKGYDYWALGHIHQRETLCEDPLIVFPGNIQGRHIRETGPKGCIIVSVDDNGVPATGFHELDVARWERCSVDISNSEDPFEVVAQVIDHIEEFLEQEGDHLLVLRIEITGICHAHTDLVANQERWTNEIRSQVLSVVGDRIWVEKVKFQTELPSDNDLDISADGPIGTLLEYFNDIQSNPDRLQKLGETLTDLTKKLPTELRDGENAIAPDDNAWLIKMLDQVKPLLLQRLGSEGGDA